MIPEGVAQIRERLAHIAGRLEALLELVSALRDPECDGEAFLRGQIAAMRESLNVMVPEAVLAGIDVSDWPDPP